MSKNASRHINTDYPDVPIMRVGLKGVCPRCGQGRLFAGMLALRQNCQSCKLDYSFADAGDGPAVFVIMIMGFVTLGLGMMLRSSLELPYWAVALLLVPVLIVGCLWGLRFGKALMIALQFHTNAGEFKATERNLD